MKKKAIQIKLFSLITAMAVPTLVWAVVGQSDTWLDIGSNTHGSTVNRTATIGHDNIVSDAQNSLAVGLQNQVQDNLGYGVDNLAVGYLNTIDADRSIAFGKNNAVYNDYSAAIGLGLIVPDEASTAVGSYNDPSAFNTYSTKDVVFNVGTGNSAISPENGLIIYHDGTIIMPKTQGPAGLPLSPF